MTPPKKLPVPSIIEKLGPLPKAIEQNAVGIADRVADQVFRLAGEIAAKRGIDLESEDGALLVMIVLGMVSASIEKMIPGELGGSMNELLHAARQLQRQALTAKNWDADEAPDRLEAARTAKH